MKGRQTPRLGYAKAGLTRDAEERDETTLDRALAHPGARLHLSRAGRWLVDAASNAAPDLSFDLTSAAALGGDPRQAVLLGWTRDGHHPRLALALPPAGEGATTDPNEPSSHDLRSLGMAQTLPEGVEGDLAQAQALLNWHARSRFCGVCGAPTRSALAGYRRDCTACDATHFPRTDPVVIMLVHDGNGACVLGRQPHFAPDMWSCLAGFVEPGETIENAVRREVREEVGLTVGPGAGTVSYALSQPWPFPGSLMIGCVALAERGAPTVQESELEAARWFERDELSAMIDGTHPDGLRVPPAYAIAHHLALHFATDAPGATTVVGAAGTQS